MEYINKIIHGDCLEKLKELPDNSIDSICTDPPYELGFMGKSWDSTGIANNKEMWAECLRVLKPGGHLLAFSGTRTYHRMASAIEDAGFEVRDMIEWVYGSGFPKSRNIGLDVDKRNGVTKNRGKAFVVAGQSGQRDKDTGGDLVPGSNTIGAYVAQNKWSGWGTALKPAHEPICMARKPLAEKTVAENCLKWGTGGINIDACRVDFISEEDRKESTTKNQHEDFGTKPMTNNNVYGDYSMVKPKNFNPPGRFPANLIHDGSDEVVGLFPNTKTGNISPYISKDEGIFGTMKGKEHYNSHTGDSGSASRFFYCAKASKRERNIGCDSIVSIMINYTICDTNGTQKENKVQLLVDMDNSQQKVIGVSGTETKNATEWNTMLFGNCTLEKFQEVNKFTTETKTNLITTSTIWNWLNHLLTNEYTAVVKSEMENGGNLAENVEKSNTLITTINEKMVSALGVNNVVSGTQLKISVKEGSNFHSTVKPIALMEYLIKMVTPKGGIVLDPFAGSGSTLVAAKQNGFNYVGIEMTEEYLPIINARLGL